MTDQLALPLAPLVVPDYEPELTIAERFDGATTPTPAPRRGLSHLGDDMSKYDQPHADLAATLREAADFIETLPADVGRPSVSASALDDGSPFVALDLRDVDEDAFRRIVDLLPGQEWTDLGCSAYACGPGLPAPIRFVNAYAVKQKPAPATVDFEAIARDIAEADQ